MGTAVDHSSSAANWPIFSDAQIVAHRTRKNDVNPNIPYAFLVEPELSAKRLVEDVATIFLTNKECPFRCLMCDLWKNTLDVSVSLGDIPRQIEYALNRLPAVQHIKLYNSGNFFDRKAIPVEDYAAIAKLLKPFKTVIVENHPLLTGEACLHFRDLLEGRLEIAMGLETIHPEVLKRLNKRMTKDDFARAVSFLGRHEIATRAFILICPPFLTEDEGRRWTIHTMEFAFECGVDTCALIPTRPGNGMMDTLLHDSYFVPPSFETIEAVFDAGLAMQKGRVFVDLWDIEQFYSCSQCGPPRRERLNQMNLSQQIEPPITCDHDVA